MAPQRGMMRSNGKCTNSMRLANLKLMDNPHEAVIGAQEAAASESALMAQALALACRKAWRFIVSSLAHDPVLPAVVGGTKKATTLDVGAAAVFRLTLRSFARGRFGTGMILDEETMQHGQIAGLRSASMVTILDPLDGTTNCLRLGAWWCVAATAITPSMPEGKRIAACSVTFEDGKTMIWSRDNGGVRVVEGRSQRLVAGPSARTTLDNAAVAFVGQSAAAQERGCAIVRALGTKTVRVWSLGGIPSLQRFIDIGPGSLGLDAIIEPAPGQVAHDVAPLLVLSHAAGACILHLEDGRAVTLAEVEQLLLNPTDRRISYIASASHQLAETIVSLGGTNALRAAA